MVATLGVVAVLAGCGSAPVVNGSPGASGPSRSPGPPEASASATSDPVALVGSWIVSDAQGAAPGTVLRLGDDLSLWGRCGYLAGSWRANDHGLFAGTVFGGDPSCVTGNTIPSPVWLESAAGFAADGAGLSLLDAHGTVVARLHPGGHPTPGSNLLPSLADPPVVTDQLRAALAPAAPLPSGLRRAMRTELVGSWVSALPRPSSGLSHHTTPGVRLKADGTYSGTDGCNGSTGRWNASNDGSVIATSGMSTLIGCDNVNVDQWLASAAWAAFDGAVLVLVDAQGAETGRLRRP